jgi:glycosyltransferase involved in cell wall biosynthesis
MRIVYMLTSLGMGGAEKQALAVAQLMAESGHVVALLVLRPHVAEQWPTPLDTIHLDMRRNPACAISGLIRARCFLRDFKPDLIHSHSFHTNVFARCLKPLFPSLKVLSTIHNVFEGGRSRMLAYRLTDPLSRQTVAVSEAVAQRFVQIKAVPHRKCTVVTNGIDLVEFAPDPARRASVRVAMGLETERRTFIWLAAGRLVAAKDFPNLLSAFEQVREKLPDVELWIAGAALDFRETCPAVGAKHSAIKIVAEQGCREQVRWLGLRRDMPALLDAADGFVSASAWEGMPLAVGEAMAMEKFVVATDVGGVRELVGGAGMVIPAQDSSALAGAMIAAMQQSERERTRSGHMARERIQQNFSIEVCAESWEALYRELIV